ncbi:uncharacterized protein PpBr36_10253 [Pyricularia pennisetigena]|uniref:uncharacterized protein n=1 Tax=Pyricularia pennisetigena TaxID=1578925 RepID=UPI001154458D|nr:uncharacterized protein PpBr36_10253 [Pyricularia pennisetigena]TLS21543.1 hypothetical protein PpBr36_10253 [Pyricularia pennisetigena]
MSSFSIPSRPKSVSSDLSNDDFLVLDEQDGLLIVGIDFGTTFSGVAWATTDELQANPNDVNLIMTWPGTGREESKCPTELSYDDDGKTHWGFDVPPDADSISWFKLLLLREEDVENDMYVCEHLSRGREFLSRADKTAVDVVADFLRAMWNHTIAKIERARGQTVVDALVFRVVITVPAIWKGYARQAMHKAAEQADILNKRAAGPTQLAFANEPEAAAMSTLIERGRRPHAGNVYVVCDAGGGTADLISYKIDQVDPISMKEAAEGKGALCGGIFIDQAFVALCKARLGDNWSRLSRSSLRYIIRDDWECGIKPQFRMSGLDKDFTVRFPSEISVGMDAGTKFERIKAGRIFFHGREIQSTFDSQFRCIVRLVDDQLEAVRRSDPEAKISIILVGGLGSSPYLYDYINLQYKAEGIEVLQATGSKPRTAICRGAVLKGFLQNSRPDQNNLPVKVTSTISRSSIGTEVSLEFDETKHLEEDKWWCDKELCYNARKQMNWFLYKVVYLPIAPGRHFSALTTPFHNLGVKLRTQFYHVCDFGTTLPTTMEISLYDCDDPVAPIRRTDVVKSMCTITFESKVNKEDYSQLTNKLGKRYRRLDYEIEMVPQGASVEFGVYIGGRKLGAQSVNVRFQ